MDKNEKYQPLIDFKSGKGTNSISASQQHVTPLPYDPLKIPPDFKIAEDYQMATRIASSIEGPKTIDGSSNLAVETKQIAICSSTDGLGILAPGYPLYFQFIRFCIIIGITMMLASGIYNVQNFASGSACIDEHQFENEATNESVETILSTCSVNIVNKFSLANKVGDTTDLDKTDIYNFFTIILLLLIMQFLRKIQKQSALLADERAVTASDYTIKVTNLPKDFKDTENIAEEIKKFFIKKAIKDKEANVQKVVLCCRCEEKCQEKEKLKAYNKIKVKLQGRKKKFLISDDEIRKIDDEIECSKAKIEKYNRMFRIGAQFEGEAYVTFETQRELQDTLKNWKLLGAKSFTERLRPESDYKFKGKLLKVVQAPEPSDVLWENAGVPATTKFILKLIANSITLVFLVAGFFLLLVINAWKVRLLEELTKYKAEDVTFTVTFLVKAVSIGSSCVIVLINQLLKSVLLFLTQYEKQSTYTEFQSTYAIRLAICQFLNTSLLTFFVSIICNNIAGPGGLIYSAFFIFVTNIIVQWGMAIFSPTTLWHWWKVRSLSNQKENCDLIQEELNAAFKYPEFDFPTKYAGYAKTIMSAAFFAPIIPMVTIVATVGIIVEYWLDKWVMLRYRSRGRSIGPELSYDFIELLEYCMVLFALGNFLANVKITGDPIWDEKITLLGTGIGILNALLPMDKINEALFPGKDEAITEDKYSKICVTFFEDYDRANPATEDGNEELSKLRDAETGLMQAEQNV